ncbi:strictosidine synthase [Mesorhizobium sp. B3-1-3]|uniref:SMP-30/gluconolactonase/LRE family protein n=1 Tax=unclassified Mesorhizobium TaxID=325217 RepID=UPI00112AE0F6|nr:MULTISPECIES: strictosidine synthase [unclassified Mesorhizobium]TPI65606.1 strictosidine synthase [Mesorhizobium sp. B3-1-3]TPI67239.1 strictosidine synthase [Mesorhizobium sp. B3-1-8]
MAALSRWYDRLRGAGAFAVTTPPMDGALQPNQAIETAELVRAAPAPDNLVHTEQGVLFSSRNGVLRLDGGGEPVHRFDADISALAAGPDGGLAIGLESGRILIKGGAHDGLSIDTLNGRPLVCPTALAFEDASTLIVCLGSSRNAPARWKRDLMQRGATGSVWRVPLGGKPACLADGLAYPNGILRAADGRLVVSESWRSRLVSIDAGGRTTTLLSDLPGYPARLSERAGGGVWLSVFAPRGQLIEFVLGERDYCDEMMRDIEEEFWIAPSLTAPRSFLEPLQGGALKQLGMLKPWAPTRSFGLVLALDAQFRPVTSWHSRADGTRHGITSCIEDKGALLITSTGGDAVLRLDPDPEALP